MALSTAHADFAIHRNIGTAAELVSAALLASRHAEAADAADFIIERKVESPRTLVEMAQLIRSGNRQGFAAYSLEQGCRTARTRWLLRLQPRNPLLWSDMARHHASHGDRKRAYQCMSTALGLAPSHRWIVRTYTRFLVHQGDAVAAHRYIATHPRTQYDPWLIAAELASAQVAGRPPIFWKQGVKLLQWDKHPPLHLSELATAAAMIELESGKKKFARKLIQKGLLAPTENALAQIIWAKENKYLSDGMGLEALVRTSTFAYEADFQMSLSNGSLLEAFGSALEWGDDEPFAARPRTETAFVATLLDDHATPQKMADMVRRIDGECDHTLELNAIFAEISSGKLDPQSDAEKILRLRNRLVSIVEQGDGDAYHAVANLALWHYRFGIPELGRLTYQSAIEITKKRHHAESAALAAVMAAREAVLARDADFEVTLQQARTLVGKAKMPAAEFYLRKVEALAKAPGEANRILHPDSASQFLAIKGPESRLVRVEKARDGKMILWVSDKD